MGAGYDQARIAPLKPLGQQPQHLRAGAVKVMAVSALQTVTTDRIKQVRAADPAGLRESRQTRPPDQRHAVLGRHAAVIECAADRWVALRHYQPMDGDDADILPLPFGAPPLERGQRLSEIQWHRADSEDVDSVRDGGRALFDR